MAGDYYRITAKGRKDLAGHKRQWDVPALRASPRLKHRVGLAGLRLWSCRDLVFD